MPRSGTVEKTSGDSKTVKKPRQVTYKISFFLWNRILCSLGCSQTHHVATDDCEFTLFLLRFWSARITLESRPSLCYVVFRIQTRASSKLVKHSYPLSYTPSSVGICLIAGTSTAIRKAGWLQNHIFQYLKENQSL